MTLPWRSSRLISLLPLVLLVGCSDDDSDSPEAPMATAGTGGTVSGGGGEPSIGGTAGSMSGTAGTGPTPVSCDGVVDECPQPSGLTHACKQRFALGINYAWHHFAGDFGGIAAWGQESVSQNPAAYASELLTMRENGVSVVRWWMFPDFRGDGVQFDGEGDPTGITPTAEADIHRALELASENDLHLVLTIFSFDNFRPDRDLEGLFVPGMAPLVEQPARRSKLIENVVRPVARAAASSPHVGNLLGWDVLNEPEWAVSPADGAPAGAQFDPHGELDTVSLEEMKALIGESITVLREETPSAQISVGWAAATWAWAFQDVDVDFHQPHIYGWVNEWWPYTSTPSELGYTGAPTVMGEFFLESMPFSDSGDDSTLGTILDSWYSNGYAGAWAWQFSESSLRANLPLLASFQQSHGCPVGY